MGNDWSELILSMSTYVIDIYLFEIVSVIVVGITYAIYEFNKGEKSSSLIFTDIFTVLIGAALYALLAAIIPILLMLAFILLILPEIW
tara:strand:+ start:106 stop:369 length:264 start_codon:yes stop_codon:yes gene_type:complete